MYSKLVKRSKNTVMKIGLFRLHVSLALILILLVSGIQIDDLWKRHEQDNARAQLIAQNLGNVLTESVGGSFRTIDVTLLAAIDLVRSQLPLSNMDRQRFDTTLFDLKKRVPGILSLRVTDASGVVLFGAGQDEPKKVFVGDRDYFQRHKMNPDAGMIISKPLVSRFTGKWVLICARRFNLSDGNFGGIVYATIQIEGMAERLSGRKLQLGDQDVFMLRDDTDNIISRYVHGKQEMQRMGQKFHSPKQAELLRTGATSGFYKSQSTVDDIERIFYFNRITEYPLYMTVGLATEDVFSDWRREARITGVITLMFALFITVGTYLYHRVQLRKLQLLADLEESNLKLLELSTTDGLTGIANRRRFDEALKEEWRRCMRSQQPLALAMFDVDFFKKYNDHYGHQKGDDCLRMVAQTLKELEGRAGDLIARYGGEEFVFIAPITDAAKARQFIEAVRLKVEGLAIPHELSSFGCVTVSIGIASMIPEVGQGPEVLIRRADEALYSAKERGRNQVVLAEVDYQTKVEA
jgi:diguanylate cyclase (GGDEF)-like protein